MESDGRLARGMLLGNIANKGDSIPLLPPPPPSNRLLSLPMVDMAVVGYALPVELVELSVYASIAVTLALKNGF